MKDNKKKIYLDNGFAVQHGGGIGVYSRLLYDGLKERGYDITLGDHPFLANLKNRIVRRILYTFYLNLILPFYLKKHHYHLAHLTNSQVPILKNNFTRYIATIHDINPITFPESVPAYYSIYFKVILKIALRCSDRIITVSQSVKDDLLNYCNLPENKVKVCQIGLNDGFLSNNETKGILQKFALQTRSYFLSVGRLEKRKNLLTLIKAFEKFKAETGSNKKLALVGAEGYGAKVINTAITASKFRNEIVKTGYIIDEELQEIYENAIAFVFSSIYEGFGIPLLEAMKFQLPIILSRIPTNLEILGSKGDYFEKYNMDELKNKLMKFENWKSMPIDYSDMLKKYTLNKMIDLHLEVYES